MTLTIPFDRLSHVPKKRFSATSGTPKPMQIGTVWEIVGILVVAIGGILGGILALYGKNLNQQVSAHKILDQQVQSEGAIRADIRQLKGELSRLQQSNDKQLRSQFPAGYQLFGIIDERIVPSQRPSSEEIKISWSTAKILRITKDFIDIMVPDAILPGNNVLSSNTIRVRNQEGATSSGAIVINNWSTFVKILKSDGSRVIAAVGYVRVNQ